MSIDMEDGLSFIMYSIVQSGVFVLVSDRCSHISVSAVSNMYPFYTECLVIDASALPLYTHTHTHPFNGPLSRTTRVSQYQKGKTNLDFIGARDSEWQ